jgi:hypothetical protein
MPTLRLSQLDLERLGRAISTAREINRTLQGTMALEGQGLDAKVLRGLKRETVSELLRGNRK